MMFFNIKSVNIALPKHEPQGLKYNMIILKNFIFVSFEYHFHKNLFFSPDVSCCFTGVNSAFGSGRAKILTIIVI